MQLLVCVHGVCIVQLWYVCVYVYVYVRVCVCCACMRVCAFAVVSWSCVSEWVRVCMSGAWLGECVAVEYVGGCACGCDAHL